MTLSAPPPQDCGEPDGTRLLAYSEAPLRIERSPVEVALTPVPSADGVTSLLSQVRADARILLRISDMERPGKAGSYDVYVNVAPGVEPADQPDHFGGRISLYGPSAAGSGGAPRKFNFILDLTQVHKKLAGGPYAMRDRVRITIVPVHEWSEPVTVGCLSLHLG